MFIMLIWLAVVVLMVASMWIVNTKAGQPGWACLVPFYNIYVMLKIAGKPGWWLVLFLLPVVNLVMAIITYIALAANFGKSTGFAIGMIFLPIVFFPMLAFGDAKYVPIVVCS